MSYDAASIMYGAARFGRKYAVTHVNGDGTQAVWGNIAGNQSPLRITFEVTRQALGAGSGKISLFNLAAESRAKIRRFASIKLEAGYTEDVGVVHLGIVTNVTTERSGPDIVTTLETRDGTQFLANATIDKSYAAGTHLASVLSDIADAMRAHYQSAFVGVNDKGVAVGIPDYTLPRFVAQGSCGDVLRTLLEPLGLLHSIQNGVLTVVPIRGHDGRQVQLLNSDTGLINIPSQNIARFGAPDVEAAAYAAQGADQVHACNMTSLLNSRLTPNALVQLASRNPALDGLYKIFIAKYTGDSYGAPWQVDLDCNKYEGSIKQVFKATSNGRFFDAISAHA